MNEQLHEQLSAAVDDALSAGEYPLLLKQLARDTELQERWSRYHLLGDIMRGTGGVPVGKGFAARVAAAIAIEPLVTRGALGRWIKPISGLAVAATVTAIALLSLQPEVSSPVSEPSVVVPVTANPQVGLGARVASGPVIQWEQADPGVQRQLNGFLLNHSDGAVLNGSAEPDSDEGPR